MRHTFSALFVLVTLGFTHLHAQDAEAIRKLTTESMVNNSDANGIQLAWLLADPFWEYVISVTPETAGTEEGQMFYDVVTEYNILAVVIGSQSQGNFTFISEKKLRSTMTLKGQDGKSYTPMEDTEISEDVQLILDVFKPIFGEFFGELGSNFQFFVFEKENAEGALIFDPIGQQDVSLEAAGKTFTWKLPMSSLLPEKRCPEDGELMNGTWNYCPIHGDELEVVKD